MRKLSARLKFATLLDQMVRGCWKLAQALGHWNARLWLGAFFFLVLTPVAVVARWRGQKFLDFGFDRGLETYRQRREHELDMKDLF